MPDEDDVMAMVGTSGGRGRRGDSDAPIQVGDLEISPGDGLVTVAGRALVLSVREFDLLLALVRGEGRIFRRAELYEDVWGSPMRPGDRTIDVYVRRLRVKLSEALPGSSFIHTHVGFGYRFSAEPNPDVPGLGGDGPVHKAFTGS